MNLSPDERAKQDELEAQLREELRLQLEQQQKLARQERQKKMAFGLVVVAAVLILFPLLRLSTKDEEAKDSVEASSGEGTIQSMSPEQAWQEREHLIRLIAIEKKVSLNEVRTTLTAIEQDYAIGMPAEDAKKVVSEYAEYCSFLPKDAERRLAALARRRAEIGYSYPATR